VLQDGVGVVLRVADHRVARDDYAVPQIDGFDCRPHDAHVDASPCQHDGTHAEVAQHGVESGPAESGHTVEADRPKVLRCGTELEGGFSFRRTFEEPLAMAVGRCQDGSVGGRTGAVGTECRGAVHHPNAHRPGCLSQADDGRKQSTALGHGSELVAGSSRRARSLQVTDGDPLELQQYQRGRRRGHQLG
jgi:hypothetical protein